MLNVSLLLKLLVIQNTLCLISCDMNGSFNGTIYRNPADWAWKEHKVWTCVFLVSAILSMLCNFYNILNYLGLLYCEENRNAFRLRPTTNDLFD
ncbi:unnamed protein product [Brachionus calyciflorus]|uniref:Uncharacterized protein n=1 Tax=Brachionus calyciflorus TaxID=104777 RepID=A0A814N660_9BILA|nr:unnamed protein product [Brachionus calyciflorus]